MGIFNHVVVEVKIGYIVVDEITDEPLVDPNGQTVLYYRKVDAERAIQTQKDLFEYYKSPEAIMSSCDSIFVSRPKAPDIPPARQYKWSWRER